MTRIIRINGCPQCEHKDHTGAFGNPAYKPICRKVNKELPYETHAHGKVVNAHQLPGLPDWCPLEKLPEGEAAK